MSAAEGEGQVPPGPCQTVCFARVHVDYGKAFGVRGIWRERALGPGLLDTPPWRGQLLGGVLAEQECHPAGPSVHGCYD